MIRVLLRGMSEGLLHPDNQDKYNVYHDMKRHAGWSTHQAMLVGISNRISEYMLSGKYTKLSKEEKDVQQRAFRMTIDIIYFLLDPLKGANRAMKLKSFNKQLGTTKKK